MIYNNLPSVKTIERVKGADVLKAKKARAILERRGESIYCTLELISVIFDAHGVEYIDAYMQDGRTSSHGVYYVNMGDTYDTTIYYDFKTSRFIVGSWGDMVEHAPSYRFTSPAEREGNKACR